MASLCHPAYAVAVLVLVAATRAENTPIEFHLTTEAPRAVWGQNIEFRVTITNGGHEAVDVSAPPLGPHHPDLYILNDNGQQLIRRSSHSGPGFTVGNNARRILPGKSEVWIVWLYHDLDYCGNLSVGKHTLVIQMPIWVRSTKVAEWRSAMVKSEPLLISVENGPVDAGTWEKVWRSIDADVLHRVSQGASSEEARAEALESLTSELNDAPMIPMVKWESGLLYLRALEATPAGAEHQRLRQRGEKLLLDLTEAADAPRSMRIQAIEKAMELHRETPDLKKVRELAGRLLTLDPDNVKAKKWLDAVDELERRGLERR